MRARNTRKVLQELRRLCRAQRLELELDRAAGKGSHQAIIIRDARNGLYVKFVIPGHDEVSPGVQRNVLKYVAGLTPRNPVAQSVQLILEELFED